ncbi:PREDICTED: ATP-binding cassette sub-family G member 1-like [Nicrophorus vespilloides]|uniref:ATP-binding cassette sub-family G member 1-like n=1 Tax=Nicrophorus vespilloides TaxID=110193 RepID=A0ABM1MSY6_NICVS|nr:PREDICTED: ATP-binding cassette sub-family G member 1-like [Nicrophorus vespilloides]
MELWRFGVFTSLGFLIIIVSQSLGLLVGILFDVVNGTFFGSAVACFQLIFGGFCITYRDMPHYLSWFYNFSFLKYGAEGMIGSVMGYERSALPCPKSDFCQYTYPEKFIDDLGINANQIELDFVLLIIMFVALRIIIYLILKMKLKRKSFCDLF